MRRECRGSWFTGLVLVIVGRLFAAMNVDAVATLVEQVERCGCAVCTGCAVRAVCAVCACVVVCVCVCMAVCVWGVCVEVTLCMCVLLHVLGWVLQEVRSVCDAWCVCGCALLGMFRVWCGVVWCGVVWCGAVW